MTKIKIKRFNDVPFPEIIEKGEWIDLCASEDIKLKAPQAKTLKPNGNEKTRDVEFKVSYIPLGVAMKLPKGYEAIVASRSSTPKNFNIICANSMGIIDNSYSGNDDMWKFPAITLKNTFIKKGTRICQFRIQLSQKATIWQKIKWLFSGKIKLVEVTNLEDTNRGGFGSTNKE